MSAPGGEVSEAMAVEPQVKHQIVSVVGETFNKELLRFFYSEPSPRGHSKQLSAAPPP